MPELSRHRIILPVAAFCQRSEVPYRAWVGASRRVAGTELVALYRILLRRHGHAGWWPGETPFEVCVGAILTQNTSWTNVEKALGGLRTRGLLSFEGLRALGQARLAPLLRSAGYFNVKARRLRAFLDFLGHEYRGEVEAMGDEDPWTLREKLLGVDGVGRETADSIALYAAGLPLFVVDAYTRRVFSRLGMIGGDESYDEIQRFFMERLPQDAALYNDYHAQIVRLAKDVCRPQPSCARCPLTRRCPRRGVGSPREPARRRAARPAERDTTPPA
jgi:endonuclease-3 related protein